jgi:alpha-galactosidase
LGLSKFSDTWVSLGLHTKDKIYVAVWRRNSDTASCILPIEYTKGKNVTVKCAYPQFQECEYLWNDANKALSVKLPKQFTARLFEITLE